MKKKIFGGIAVMAIAVAVALNVSLVNNKADKASLLALANVEALAEAEGDKTGYKSMLITEEGGDYECINGKSYKVTKYSVNCLGSGTMSCNSGSFETLTYTGASCGNV